MTQDSAVRAETGSAHRLIASNRVEGTAVYNREGEKLGRIEYFMVDKRSGRADYAVMSFGGLFGLGDHHHPLPWDVLDYDTGARRLCGRSRQGQAEERAELPRRRGAGIRPRLRPARVRLLRGGLHLVATR